MEDFSHIFEGVEEPRRSNATRHDLHEMLMIGLLATLCGGEGCSDMALFGREKEAFLRDFMQLEYGIPSHDAFSDLFNALDPASFQPVMQRLVEGLARDLEDVIAIDGKVLRRSFTSATNRKNALTMVQAFAVDARLVLGQIAVREKSNEITAMPALLDLLDLDGRIVTADAMHTQRATAKTIKEKGGDWLLVLKANQGTLFDDVSLFMGDPENDGIVASFQSVDAPSRRRFACLPGNGVTDGLRRASRGSAPRWCGCTNATNGRDWRPSRRSPPPAKPAVSKPPPRATTSPASHSLPNDCSASPARTGPSRTPCTGCSMSP